MGDVHPGDIIEVAARAVAHGGHCIAGIPGDERRRAVFLRHALPGEVGRARVTAVRRGGRLVFADLVEVVEPSPHRVVPPCPAAGPGRCGGCDFQHVELGEQRRLKAAVIADALRRIGGLAELPWDGAVRPVPGDEAGLRWRTRSRFGNDGGALTMRLARSDEEIEVADCLIARRAVVSAAAAEAVASEAAPGGEVLAVESGTGQVVAGDPRDLRRTELTERVGGREFAVSAAGFWQVHPGAAAALSGEVARVLDPRPGERLLDLFGGVGLFAGTVGDQAALAAIDLVEGDATAVAQARANLADLPARCHRAAVAAWLSRRRGTTDLVVLDPPRAGAGPGVIRDIVRLRPRRVAYVACDPAGLARDLAVAGEEGYRLVGLTAFDIFPMTQHVECVAALEPGGH